MGNPLLRKISTFTKLSRDDETLLMRVISERARCVGAREDVAREGESAAAINLFETGWGCRYKTLEDGRRQIVALLLPGDFIDLNVFMVPRMDHSVGTITGATIVEISQNGYDELMGGNARLRQALQWDQLVSAAIQREWALNLGQRSAYERLAHLLCETFFRLRAAGLADGNRCDFPLTQTDLGEATGLSTVHVNRTLQELRARELIVLRDRTLYIPDLDALQDAAQFDPGYLHLDREGRHLDANERV